MTTKEYLKQLYRLDGLINSDIAEVEQLKQLALSVPSPKLTGMPSGGHKKEAAFVSPIQKIIDLEAYINSEIDRFVDLKKEIHDVINQVPDNGQKLVLKCRYILFMKWEAVASEMGLSLKQVHRLHSEALKHIRIDTQ